MTTSKEQGYWKRGQQAEISRLADISDSHLSDLLHRRKGCSVSLGRRLERVTREVLGTRIPWETWATNKYTNHPAFLGEPIADEV